MVETDRSDSNYEPLQENLRRLREMTDQDGHPLRVETMPMPEPVYFDRQRLPASYANFYIGNSSVLLPVFGDSKNDANALETLSHLFPRRQVIPIDCRELVHGFGGIHCVTQQQPSADG